MGGCERAREPSRRFTVIRQNYSRPFRDWIPYVVALVDLEEGPRVMTNIVGCDPEDVTIGMRVVARFEQVSDEAGIALFEPEALVRRRTSSGLRDDPNQGDRRRPARASSREWPRSGAR